MKKKIYINRHHIRANKKGANKPVLTIATYKEKIRCNGCEILGDCRIVYKPDKPLNCGATVWIETEAKIITISSR